MSAVAEFVERAGEDFRADRTHTNLRADSQELRTLLAESGPRASKRARQTAAYKRRISEALGFWSEILGGNRNALWMHEGGVAIGLEEAMGTSDFPLLTGDILDRSLLGRYQEQPAGWRNYIGYRAVRDFRQVREIAVDGLEGRLVPDYKTAEMEEPRESALSETGYLWNVEVYQRIAALNWRLIINDDLDAFTDIPVRFARGARRTQEYYAATLLADTNGPSATFFTNGNSNIVNTTNLPSASDDNPALSTVAIQDALTLLMSQTDADGEPIMFDSFELVVPTSLKITAENIIQTMQYRVTDSSGNVIQLVTGNGLGANIRVTVNPYLSVVSSNANGATSWYLIATPMAGARPAFRMGSLRGYEEPGLYRLAGNTERVGGGIVPELGDFHTNEQKYKVMLILGGRQVDPKCAVASNGSGS